MLVAGTLQMELKKTEEQEEKVYFTRTWGPHRNESKTLNVVRPGDLYTILTKGNISVEKWQDKGKGLEILRAIHCGKVNIRGN